jgi:hypothetical protein
VPVPRRLAGRGRGALTGTPVPGLHRPCRPDITGDTPPAAAGLKHPAVTTISELAPLLLPPWALVQWLIDGGTAARSGGKEGVR